MTAAKDTSSFLSSVHTTSEEFENVASILRGKAFCLYKSVTKMELYENAIQTGGICKRGLCVLVLTKTIWQSDLFIRWRYDNPLPEFDVNANEK